MFRKEKKIHKKKCVQEDVEKKIHLIFFISKSLGHAAKFIYVSSISNFAKIYFEEWLYIKVEHLI